MQTMTINCPEWLPELSAEQMQGRGVWGLLQRYAKGKHLAEFREVFYWRYFRARMRRKGGAAWLHTMHHYGYVEDAGWCYVD